MISKNATYYVVFCSTIQLDCKQWPNFEIGGELSHLKSKSQKSFSLVHVINPAGESCYKLRAVGSIRKFENPNRPINTTS